ncbi:MAG: PQQ-binding-like beta-propeller repeat protein [Euryarchaeota archaeon]|nr:PQQ-binding-like beta-propeller repeat protein [Euryarchaeota archaeon]
MIKNRFRQFNPKERFFMFKASCRVAVLLFIMTLSIFALYLFSGEVSELEWKSERLNEENTSFYQGSSSNIGVSIWVGYTGDVIAARLIAANGLIYVASMDGRVYAYDAELGAKVWETEVTLPFTWSARIPVGGIVASPVYYNGILYVVVRQGGVVALNALTGKVLWDYNMENMTAVTPTIVDGQYMVISDNTGAIFILDLSTKKIVRYYHFREFVWAKAAYDGARYVYLGTSRGRIVKLDKEGWDIVTQTFVNGGVTGAIVYDKGYLYITTNAGYLYKLLAENLSVVWSLRLMGPIYGGPSISDKYVFVAGMDTNVYCIEKKTGRIIWKVGLKYESSSSIAVSESYIYLVDDGGYVYCIDIKTGTILWMKEEFSGAKLEAWKITSGLNLVRGLQGPIIYRGNVYVGLIDKRVIAYGEGGRVSISPLILYSAVVVAIALIIVAGIERRGLRRRRKLRSRK